MNYKTLTISLLVFALLIAALAARSGAVAWLALPFLCYLGAGILQSPARESVRLEAERQVTRTGAGGESRVQVRVAVRNLGASIARLEVSDLLPEGLTASSGQARRKAALRGGEELQLSYSCQEKRGSYTWQAVHAVVSDPFGLVKSGYLLPAGGEIQVQPARDPLRRLPLRPRSTLHSPGSIPARLAGSGTDFWGVREYQPGDPLRWLDWRLTARHPRKLFTREFEQEEIADIGLILDGREKTNMQQGDDSLFEHSVSAAAALAEAFLHQGHRVSLLAFGGKLEMVFPGYGKVQLNKIMRCLANVRAGSTRVSEHLEILPLNMFSSRALLVVLTPLDRSDWQFFLRLRAAGFQGLLISPDPFDFWAHPPTGSPAARLGLRAARLERCLELRDIAQLGIPVIDWRVSQPLYPLVRSALNSARVGRLARQRSGIPGGKP
jgi:uncharacterized protein (DUF58 family)